MNENKIAAQIKRKLTTGSLIDVDIMASANGFDRMVDTIEQMGLNYRPFELQRTVRARLTPNDIVHLSSKSYIAQISESYKGE